jgi:hypothetical protein
MDEIETIEIDHIVDGILIEKTDKKKMDAARRKRLFAAAFDQGSSGVWNE